MPTAQTLPTVFSGSASGWDASLYAFLAEKQRRSGSNRTPDSYYRTLRHFFGSLQKSPDQVSPQDVFSFAHGVGLSGREPSRRNRRRPALLHLFLLQVPHQTRSPQGQSLRSRRAPQASVPAPQAASPLPRCNGSSTVIPDTLKGRTRPGHRPHSRPHRSDADPRSSTSQPAISPSTIPPPSTAILGKGGLRGRRELPSSRALGRHTADLLVMPARTSPPCTPPSRSGRPALALQGVSSASTFYNRFRTYLRKGRPPSVGRARPTPHRRQAPS